MNQADLYELQIEPDSQAFDSYHPLLMRRDQFVVGYISRLFEGLPPKVAELSVGNGRLTFALLQKFPGLSLDCFDISPSRIQALRQYIGNSINFDSRGLRTFECNFDTQFSMAEDARYQALIALDIMEHVFDVFGFLNNCRRTLANEGLLFLRVPNIAYIKHRISLLGGNIPVTASWFGPKGDLTAWEQQHGWDGGHLHYFTVPILYQLLENFGFQVDFCRDPGSRFENFRNLAPNLLYANPLIVARKK